MGYGQNNQNQVAAGVFFAGAEQPGERGYPECIPGDVLGACRDE